MEASSTLVVSVCSTTRASVAGRAGPPTRAEPRLGRSQPTARLRLAPIQHEARVARSEEVQGVGAFRGLEALEMLLEVAAHLVDHRQRARRDLPAEVGLGRQLAPGVAPCPRPLLS